MASRIFRIQYTSGLHLEMYKHVHFPTLVKPAAPYLALAGNIATIRSPHMMPFLHYVSNGWEKVFYVSGVKEYYEEDKLLKLTNKFRNIALLHEDTPAYSFRDKNVTILGSCDGSPPIQKHINYFTYQKSNIILLTHHMQYLDKNNTQIRGWIQGYEDSTRHESIPTVSNEGSFPLEDAYEFSNKAVLEIDLGPDDAEGADIDLTCAATGIAYHRNNLTLA